MFAERCCRPAQTCLKEESPPSRKERRHTKPSVPRASGVQAENGQKMKKAESQKEIVETLMRQK